MVAGSRRIPDFLEGDTALARCLVAVVASLVLSASPAAQAQVTLPARAEKTIAAPAQPSDPGTWSEIAADDLHFIRAVLRENHPGPMDPLEGAFRDWHRRGFEMALARARLARDYSGYYHAVKSYVVGFQDGHLGALGDRPLDDPKLSWQWPGFLVARKGGRFWVQEVEPGRQGPLPGDELLACDGRPVDDVARERLGTYVGLWSVEGVRDALAPYLLLDAANPFVRRPSRIRLQRGGRRVDLALRWSAIPRDDLRPRIARAAPQHLAEPGIKALGPDRHWISIPSFAVDASSDTDRLLLLSKEIASRAEELRGSELLVFDLRGNRGGNSAIGRQIASLIWGEPFARTAVPAPVAILWRASTGNLAFLNRATLATARSRFGEDFPRVRQIQRLVEGVASAVQAGDPFYVDQYASPAPPEAALPVRAQVFVVTDGACASACLDFLDLVLRAPGVRHVGRTTSADTVYIDNRAEPLPSGLGSLGFSMKRYQGRARGHNEPYRPAQEWKGPMDDTAGLERWILGLANLR